jgi:uncharacterized RDD family membrane protein YckC
VKPANFWLRALAHLIDSIILNVASWLLQLGMFWPVYQGLAFLAHRRGDSVAPFDDYFNPWLTQIADAILYIALAALYFVWGQLRYGTTPGKWPFRIRVVDAKTRGPISAKQAWIRFGSYALSYVPLGCGYLMALFHPERKALHDLIAGTISVRAPKASMETQELQETVSS